MRQWRTLAAFFLIELEPHVTVAKSVECTCIAMYICATVWSPLAPPMFALKYSEHRRGTGEIDDALCNYLHYSYGSRMVARRALPTDPHAVLFVTNYSIVTKCCTSARFASSYVVDKFELVELVVRRTLPVHRIFTRSTAAIGRTTPYKEKKER